jgi:hypothetical protein
LIHHLFVESASIQEQPIKSPEILEIITRLSPL